jgi:hypothetical protein
MDGNLTHLGGDGTYQFPSTDGTSGHVLTTNGSGALSFTNLSTTPIVFGVQTLTGSGGTEVISLTDTVTLLVTTGSDQAFSLADGTEGQLKIISMKTDGGDGIVTPANFVNGTRITFNDVEDTVTLLYQTTGWVALARQNAIFS